MGDGDRVPAVFLQPPTRKLIMTTLPARIGTALVGACLVVSMASPARAQSSPPPAPQTPGASNGKSLPRVASIEPDYRLTPGDKLRVEVYKDAQLSQSLQVRPDGKVTLPLVGDIVATDLTPIQLRDRITNSLKEYITNPVVTVIVVEASPVMVYVMGEVMQPGSIPMRGSMTVLQALAMAGGFREFANPKNIRILRKGRGNSTAVETIRFNYNDAIKGNQPPLFLSPGDMIVVP
jgi:polysaccharide biosynthesis/export protein